jgi:hypothetical protein
MMRGMDQTLAIDTHIWLVLGGWGGGGGGGGTQPEAFTEMATRIEWTRGALQFCEEVRKY